MTTFASHSWSRKARSRSTPRLSVNVTVFDRGAASRGLTKVVLPPQAHSGYAYRRAVTGKIGVPAFSKVLTGVG
jgi:hypothetical protein